MNENKDLKCRMCDKTSFDNNKSQEFKCKNKMKLEEFE